MLPFPFPATDTSSPFKSMRSSHPCLRVPDYEAAIEWYVRSFDFRVVKEWPGPDGLRLAYLAAPGDNGVPVPDDFWESLAPARYHHFAFSVPSHKDALGALADRGVNVVQAPFEVPELGYSVAFVADPWGNLIELVELST